MKLEPTADLLPLTTRATSENNLVCPECGNEWLHLDGAHLEFGDSSLCQGKRAVELCRTSPAGWGRGPSIRIALWCESGHSTWLDLIEHKGRIHVQRSRQSPDATTRDPAAEGLRWQD